MQITCDMLKKGNACCYESNDAEMIEVIERLPPMTPMDVLDCKEFSLSDRFWVLLRPEIIPEPELHELACKFAADVLPIWDAEYPDDARPRNAIEAKRRWLRGEINDDELNEARDLAGVAACVAWEGARSVACAAWEAARVAAVSLGERSAEGAVARSAQWLARAAAENAVRAVGDGNKEIKQKQMAYVREVIARLYRPAIEKERGDV